MAIELLSLEQLKGHDVYELAYADAYPDGHWSANSLYLTDDAGGIVPLIPYLEKVFGVFHYYGPEKVTLRQWSALKAAYREDESGDPANVQFFDAVDRWLERGNGGAGYFWILGI